MCGTDKIKLCPKRAYYKLNGNGDLRFSVVFLICHGIPRHKIEQINVCSESTL